jgi:hypothetical protein
MSTLPLGARATSQRPGLEIVMASTRSYLAAACCFSARPSCRRPESPTLASPAARRARRVMERELPLEVDHTPGTLGMRGRQATTSTAGAAGAKDLRREDERPLSVHPALAGSDLERGLAWRSAQD